MVKASQNISQLFPRLLHVTCLAHQLHRDCEYIRESYIAVDDLIASGKAIFDKSSARVRGFQKYAPGVPLPPEPVITRCGTWLNAALYYHEHLEAFQGFVRALNPDKAESIVRAQKQLSSPAIRLQLAAITSNFGFLIGSITQLEQRGLRLSTTISVFLYSKINI